MALLLTMLILGGSLEHYVLARLALELMTALIDRADARAMMPSRRTTP